MMLTLFIFDSSLNVVLPSLTLIDMWERSHPWRYSVSSATRSNVAEGDVNVAWGIVDESSP
jgi:hypothetical protein